MRATWECSTQRLRLPRPVERTTELAIWIMLGTLSRVGALMAARWADVDLEAGTWFVPKENQKKHRGRRYDLIVQMSPFVKRQFDTLHAITSGGDFCFPSASART